MGLREHILLGQSLSDMAPAGRLVLGPVGFRGALCWLSSLGFNPIGVDELISGQRGESQVEAGEVVVAGRDRG